ncbi:Alcohol O-acetyltransferase 1 [Wickerhamomyces ciferrii]|uniref:Alcohol O-acetyltransferase 1 n=1 Tax=Wickerhamomyces ciferrii (strain ATCC 14091 / BCRC 22168 / CBS 111 / JCM 3599 / NBRC 0793 / NRRL Y-1031 F-60-10) TaxID=1206466 RepID=K0KYF2_WICCF|nr:Alcohol O-acetyltransferase 1 [Wickerhamomyces ciferrii]CCH47107.1 Alcohol O-acetyltransferase 1 [Wickerhamomyces ciferrii]
MYKSFFVMCKYNEKIDDFKILFHSLRLLILKFPILASTIITQNVPINIKPRPYDYIQIIDEIKFNDLVWDLRPEYSNLLQEDLLNKLNDLIIPYEDNKLVWRLGILDDYTLIFITNHVLHDGISGKNIFNELSLIFNQLDLDSLSDDDDIVFNYSQDHLNLGELPKPITDLMNHIPSIKSLPRYIYNSLIEPKLFCSSTLIQGHLKNIHYRVNINPMELLKIKSLLSKNSFNNVKLTLTPFIQSIWNYTLYQDEYYKSSKSLLGIAVDSRQFINKDEQDLYKFGLNVSGFSKISKPMKLITWNKINQINQDLKISLKLKKPLYSMGILGWDKMIKNKHLDVDLPKIMNKRTGSTFSNIGIILNNSESNDKFQIIDAMFTQHFNVHFYDFSITAISTMTGGLNIIITSPESIGIENLERICKKFHENLVLCDIK